MRAEFYYYLTKVNDVRVHVYVDCEKRGSWFKNPIHDKFVHVHSSYSQGLSNSLVEGTS